MKINVEINLDELGLYEDGDGNVGPGPELHQQIIDSLTARMSREAAETITRTVESVAQRQAEELVTKILSGPIYPTDNWGHQRGEYTTVAALVMAQVDRWMRPPSRDSFSRSENLGECLQKVVDELIRKELKPTIEEAKKAIHGEVLRRAVEGAAAALADARIVTK
jgi:histone H3/H4